jgi:UDP-glucose 4-epimerase
MYNILITGGAGFIGSNLAKYLAKSNKIFIVDDYSSGQNKIQSENIKYIKGNISKINLDSFEEKFDFIYHFAAISRIGVSFENINKTFDVNLMGTINVLEYCKKHKAKLIFSSTSCCAFNNINHNLANPYALSKKFGEDICKFYYKNFKLNISIARFFNIYGNEEKNINKFSTLISIFDYNKKNNLPFVIFGDGSKRRDFLHINDLVKGLSKLKKLSGFNCLNFGSGENFSVLEIAKLFDPIKIVFKKDRKGELQATLSDISLTKLKLNWTPKISLIDYIERLKSSSTVPVKTKL